MNCRMVATFEGTMRPFPGYGEDSSDELQGLES
jgi:hypothetical protein